jgi:hypothetical protein
MAYLLERTAMSFWDNVMSNAIGGVAVVALVGLLRVLRDIWKRSLKDRRIRQVANGLVARLTRTLKDVFRRLG